MLAKLTRSVLVLFGVGSSGLAVAYDSDALINAAVSYLVSADLHTKLSQGNCSYVSFKQVPSIELRIEEVRRALNDRDASEFVAFLNSPEYKAKLRHNQKILDDLLRSFSSGVDRKTACGMLWGVLTPTFTKAENDWASLRKD